MTNEEAIKILNEIEYPVNGNNKEYRNMAFDMAIKALEQEPCEDCISREAVIEWLKTKDIIKLSSQEETARRELTALSSIKPQEPCDCISRQAVLDIAKSSKSNWIDNSVLFKRVNDLPPVTPKPKTGRWINGDDKCPCCGKSKFEGLDADIWADWKPKYCPNCGAKMFEPQESEDKE